MDAKRLKQIKKIYHAALEVPAGKQRLFVEKSCGADESLLREVKSLLVSDKTFDSLIDTPPQPIAAEVTAEKNRQTDFTGAEIKHYKIVKILGKGGMGEVYLAEDNRLRRRIALKILPEEIAADAERLMRFEREAHAASALNHPNILTIFEFGNEKGVHFLASEFVEGKTLREMMSAGRVELADALKITIQVASALRAAHAAGIIHRDVKPENIMIRDDGYVKVLDFGLAKISDQFTSWSSELEETRTHFQTQAGSVMGTAAYMSPEQARGKKVDNRTDIFSLGIVLYELLTRRLPFSGETINHLLVSIIDKEPPPISTPDFQIPGELERITLRALEKNTDYRYQNASDLMSDLRALKKRFEFEAELQRTSLPDANAVTHIFTTETMGRIEKGNTIAVLPFVNMSRNEDGDYFSDGLAEELINVLSKIKGLQVAARTSTFSFKRKQATIAEIGQTLSVASVLEGSVRIAGSRVRISTQLIKVADGYHLWSETYDRTMDDIFAVQDDIAQSVVEELRVMLLGENARTDPNKQITFEVAEAVKGRAANAEAQRLMLLGRHFLDRTTREDTAQAIIYFKEALEMDAEYALCWAELGRAYSIEAGRGWIPVARGFDLSREAAMRSLSLEPDLAEAHAQLGRIQIAHDWDFRGAESSYQKALQLAPGSSSVLDGAAVLAYKLGRFDEALELSRRVLVQDPLSAAFWHNFGLTCHAAGQLADSEKAYEKALELVPQRFVSRALLALVMMETEQIESALIQATLEPDEFWKLWSLTILYYSAGRDADSDETLQVLTESFTDGNAYQIAEVHSMRRETDLAFNWLEKAYEKRDPGMTHAKVNPRFRPLYDDPRWAAILTKIGFEL